MQVAAIIVCLAVTATGVALFAKAVARFVATFRLGRPDPSRTGDPVRRTTRWSRSSPATPGWPGCRWWQPPTGP